MLRHPPFNAQAGLDVETLRPRVPALGLVSAVAGMPGRDAVGRPEGEGRRAGRSPESRCSGTPPLTRKLATSRKKKGTMNRHQTTSMTGRKHGPKINARGVHATGSDPSGLGIMQPEGRPQQSELRT